MREFGNLKSKSAWLEILHGDFHPSIRVWNTSFAKTYNASLSALAFERYPTDNCFSRYGYGTYHDPQQVFANYTTHTNGQNIVNEYLGSQLYAQSLNKPLMMLETNSASCGGFPGVSDAFGAGLWAVDYAMQMAYSNFSVALFHVGGQNVSYNVRHYPLLTMKKYLTPLFHHSPSFHPQALKLPIINGP